MFTGIIETVGSIKAFILHNEKARMRVSTNPEFGNFNLGESIAVNGVCLTVCETEKSEFWVDISTETLNRTSLKELKEDSCVNLERALTPNKSISGHFVMGHIDQIGRVAEIQTKPGESLFRFEHPPELSPFIIEKGSIAIDGISLTLFNCKNDQFTVSIIPFTLEHTNLKDRKLGDIVNLECDMIGKYVVKACESVLTSGNKSQGISLDFLKQQGYLKRE